jgi:hypothetical protein
MKEGIEFRMLAVSKKGYLLLPNHLSVGREARLDSPFPQCRIILQVHLRAEQGTGLFCITDFLNLSTRRLY